MPDNPDSQNTALERGRRKVRMGVVVSNKMDKSIVVRVDRTMKHPLYKKVMRRSKKYMAHDPENTCKIGDTVRIMECRPMSARKRWRLVEVVKRSERPAEQA
jgi:small subunit ribosomal protein S17